MNVTCDLKSLLITYKANKINKRFLFSLESSIHAAEIETIWIPCICV